MESSKIFKLLLVGNTDVGKSSLLYRYVDGTFSETSKSTVGVDYKSRNVDLTTKNGKNVKLHIWDTCGQEKFRTITTSYYRDSHGVILVYDITEQKSFDHIKHWLREVEQYADGNLCKLIVGNKTDFASKRVVPFDTAKKFADELQIPYMETSAKSGEMVSDAFLKLATDINNMRNALA